ncbi:hypothetical protein F5B19DRAFT_182253 [Rostrohypoxylon terebratum]|nr:hypothetical protein F5B19DRAFT_182253 [Rostrohypoxylon terebratum]
MWSKFRMLASFFSRLCHRGQPENVLRSDTTHGVESTVDGDLMSYCSVEHHDSDASEMVESEHNQGGTRGDPGLLLNHDYFLFYTTDSSNSNSFTKAFMARNSPGKNSTIQVSTMKLLHSNARVGEFYTLSWRVGKQESRFSTKFETIRDKLDDFQVVLGTERLVDPNESQCCISIDYLEHSESSAGRTVSKPLQKTRSNAKTHKIRVNPLKSLHQTLVIKSLGWRFLLSSKNLQRDNLRDSFQDMVSISEERPINTPCWLVLGVRISILIYSIGIQYGGARFPNRRPSLQCEADTSLDCDTFR